MCCFITWIISNRPPYCPPLSLFYLPLFFLLHSYSFLHHHSFHFFRLYSFCFHKILSNFFPSVYPTVVVSTIARNITQSARVHVDCMQWIAPSKTHKHKLMWPDLPKSNFSIMSMHTCKLFYCPQSIQHYKVLYNTIDTHTCNIVDAKLTVNLIESAKILDFPRSSCHIHVYEIFYRPVRNTDWTFWAILTTMTFVYMHRSHLYVIAYRSVECEDMPVLDSYKRSHVRIY